MVHAGYRRWDGYPVAIKHVYYAAKFDDMGRPYEVYMLERCTGVPGVIDMLDWYEDGSGGYWLVMERPARCMDLFNFVLTHDALTETCIHKFFSQMLTTVHACAKLRGVVHDDLKPENFLVCLDTGEVKLIDFGLAYTMRPSRSDGPGLGWRDLRFNSYTGTWGYEPPEWRLIGRYDGLKKNVWGLGCILYTMLTRKS